MERLCTCIDIYIHTYIMHWHRQSSPSASKRGCPCSPGRRPSRAARAEPGVAAEPAPAPT